MNDIVVGIDKSDTSKRAALKAAELAAAFDTNLHVVMCVDKGRSVEMEVGSDRFHLDSLAEAEQFLQSTAQGLPHDQFTTAAFHGDPAKVLCEEAERLDARAIVVGNRRVQGVARVLGSIASDVNRHAPCDVYVAHTSAG